MPDPIRVTASVLIPGDAVRVRAVRSSGPGGQNVNKVASKIELRIDLGRIQGMTQAARSRLQTLAGHRLDSDGWLLITSQRYRDQPRNLDDARAKVRALVTRALVAPKTRHATRPTHAARERRLADKRREAVLKRRRRAPIDSD